MIFAVCNIICRFQRNLCAWDQYLNQVPVISSIKYKQVVRKVGLSEQLTNIDRRIRFSKIEANAGNCLKRKSVFEKPHSTVIRNILNV